MGESKKISEKTYNALAEIGNIGAGNAATSLSVILSSKLTMTPPEVSVCDFNEIENLFGGPETTVVGVLSSIEGELNAMMLFLLDVGDAEQLVDSLIDNPVAWHSEMGISAIKEIANIIIGSYTSSLETLSGMKMRHTVPEICIDMAGAILSVPCSMFGQVGDRALLINSHFYSGEKRIKGYITVVSAVNSYDEFLNKLGIGGVDE